MQPKMHHSLSASLCIFQCKALTVFRPIRVPAALHSRLAQQAVEARGGLGGGLLLDEEQGAAGV